MPFTCRACLHFLYVAPLLLLTLAVFGATLILGLIGIARATESNQCANSNTTECTNLTPLNSGINGSQPQTVVADDPNVDEFTYWLAGATGCGLVFAIVATFSLWALEDALRRVRKPSKKSLAQPEIEMEEKGESADAHRSPSPPPRKHLDTIGEHDIFEKLPSNLRKLNAGAVIALFFSSLLFVLAVVGLLWAIAIGLNHSNRQETTITSFVIVELLTAIIIPILFFLSGIIMANVVDFVTLGAADARMALPHFLQAVKFEKGEKFDHWIIADSFYFQLTKRNDRTSHGFCYSCYPNFATWVLVGILSLIVNLAVSYFADITIDSQVSVTSCDDARIDSTFDCFNSSTLAFVDCNEEQTVELIHCFRFHRFGVDTDLIQAVATTFAFFLFGGRIFSYLFLGLKVALHISQRRIWGGFLIVAGIVMFIGSCILIVIWLNGYISAAAPELSRLNVISLGQFIMVSLFVLLIGLLMIAGKWAEREKKKQQ